jgi:di/tricarboxylate transporter
MILLFLIVLPRWISDTAAILIDLISPADLFIVMLYSLITGISALIKPPAMKRNERETVIRNDHFLNINILSDFIIPGILSVSKIISENIKNRNPYNINASQKPPIIFRVSLMTEECLDSRNLAAMKIVVTRKKVIA